MLKKLLILSLLLVASISYGQKEKVLNLPSFDKPLFHYGFYLGLNTNGYKIAYRPNNATSTPNIEVESSIGFNVGLIGDLRLHNNVNLRFEPGLISNTKTLRFKHINSTNENITTREVDATFLHLPFILKVSANRLNNIRPYVLAGVSYDYNFSSNENNSDDNAAGKFRTKTSNFMYEVGIGMDFYLTYFKFSPSIRGIFALNNEVTYDNSIDSQWTAPIDFLGTRGIFLHLSFE
ncbi:PorT protein [Tenacibaculum holothuriorum]|uniref:PorT protein n=1 Tax=Tenacibaculum holothuriorum TaxID=1635173 RepID=A0A1Y2PAJ6_9FLAO|nr:porin family protein [Tenacibaculum holothuriorum]OSY87452.1 PorT protein [Tenacibaculum holothuriorum]